MKGSKKVIAIALGALLLFGVIRLFVSSAPQPKLAKTKLVLFLVVDQFPFEYRDRFAHLFRKGLRRVFTSGTVFSNAHFTHSITATCPGHASLVSGQNPNRHGVVGNWWWDTSRNDEVYCVGDAHDRSPRFLAVSSLVDWLKDASRESKAYAVSGKDRAAIMLGGKRPDGVFWYDKYRGWFDSTPYYYPSGIPWWVKHSTPYISANRYFGQSWEPLPVSKKALRRAEIVELDEGVYPDRFPHALGRPTITPDESFYKAIYGSPFLDKLTIEFAERLITKEKLGQRDAIDYLGLSLSALDVVGHGYGPHSREVTDVLVRLDEWLDEFFSFLDRTVGEEKVLLVFTSDHGIPPFPEYLNHQKGHDLGSEQTAFRERPEDVSCIQSVGREIGKVYGRIFQQGFYLQPEAEERGKIPEVSSVLSILPERCEAVQSLLSHRDLARKRNRTTLEQQYWNNYYAGRSADFSMVVKPNFLFVPGKGTNHGSPHSFDTHVPIVFSQPGLPVKEVDERVAPIDIAPTIAELLGITPDRSVEGGSLWRFLKE